ncbi:MAG: PEP-CTERM sorting domain-containing protein, partial [Terrimicrobiaceae bacterium]
VSNITLNNHGAITQIGGSSIKFESNNVNSPFQSILNNAADGTYELTGDGSFAAGDFYNGYSYTTTPGAGVGTINNAGTFRKSGGTGTSTVASTIAFNNSGTVEVDSGTVNFQGSYTQSNGKLVLKNGGAVTGTLNIQGGALEGTGTVNGSVTLAGTLSPGFSPGSMVINGNLNLQPSAITLLEIAGTLNQGVDYNYVCVNGSILASGLLQLSLLSGHENFITPSTVLTLVTANQITGNFFNIASGERLTTLDGWGSFQVDYTGGNLIVSNFIAIPEPSSLVLFVIAGWIIVLLRWKGSSHIIKHSKLVR